MHLIEARACDALMSSPETHLDEDFEARARRRLRSG